MPLLQHCALSSICFLKSSQELSTFFLGYGLFSKWFLLVLHISFFLFLKIMFTVLLGEKVSSLSVAHVDNLLIPCNAVVAILLFLLVIYIVRSSAKSNLSTPFLRMPLVVTRKKIMLSTSSYIITWSMEPKNDIIESGHCFKVARKIS